MRGERRSGDGLLVVMVQLVVDWFKLLRFFYGCFLVCEEDGGVWFFLVPDAMVLAFFNGQQLPKCVTHTNPILLPKKKEVNTFSDLRPISLSNFINKIFSRVIHERLVELLPNLISEEQSGFVKGRSIV
ncbi:PREDICTED: uncharacterized protein LOC109220195 [Nicotiana attenuata]|uniref:uncharacterized protein LOC109220195 n=1 Tax=Nicotiana attenuata TaxID=49451 RepID=UPI000905C538|nr:PREDICTED: uncharacterized protein LOC109220195 [Nicotiana attenuata]